MDGCGLAEKIRRLVPREETALIAVTGQSDPDELARIVSSGFDDYLRKPIAFEKLTALVAQRLEARAKTPVRR